MRSLQLVSSSGLAGPKNKHKHSLTRPAESWVHSLPSLRGRAIAAGGEGTRLGLYLPTPVRSLVPVDPAKNAVLACCLLRALPLNRLWGVAGDTDPHSHPTRVPEHPGRVSSDFRQTFVRLSGFQVVILLVGSLPGRNSACGNWGARASDFRHTFVKLSSDFRASRS